MKQLLRFTLLCIALATAAVGKIIHTGHKVIRAFPQTAEHFELLRGLQSDSSVDFWTIQSKNGFADIHVEPESYNKVVQSFADIGLNYVIHIDDLGVLEVQEQQDIALQRSLYNGKALDLTNYHTYGEVMSYLDDLANTNPLVTTLVGGVTVEGRNIVQAIISSDLSAKKPVIFFDCNVHAREWVTAATCVWIIDKITSEYGIDPEITSLVDQYDWKFIPIGNPDGYVYTWDVDRLWRKNRVVNINSTCLGVDINRNFEVGYDLPDGSSDAPCGNTYRGEAFFSERETQTIRDLASADRGRIKAAISIHSYGQQWLSPYGYTTTYPSDYAEMFRVMDLSVIVLSSTYGNPYTYGSFANALYLGTGVSSDYYYASEGITHSYTVELRDLGKYGFVLPADQIIPTATEAWNGLKTLVKSI